MLIADLCLDCTLHSSLIFLIHLSVICVFYLFVGEIFPLGSLLYSLLYCLFCVLFFVLELTVILWVVPLGVCLVFELSNWSFLSIKTANKNQPEIK